jgi:hypothetical protein
MNDSLQAHFSARGFTIGGHTVGEFRFIKAWQTARNVNDVKHRLGIPQDVENSLLSQLAGRLRRDNNVPLKKFTNTSTYTRDDYQLMSEYARWVASESINGAPDEQLTYERFVDQRN